MLLNDLLTLSSVQSNYTIALLQITMSTTQSYSYSPDELQKLLTAASRGDLATLHALVRDDANIDAVSTYDDDSSEHDNAEGRPLWTMLTIASHHREIAIIHFLRRKGASMDFHPLDGETALLTAAHQGHADVFDTLQSLGADVNRTRHDRASVLHEAVADVSSSNVTGKMRIMDILFGMNFPVDKIDDTSDTALHHAALIGSLTLVIYLVQHNADYNARNKFGDSPLDKAAMEGHTNVVEYLLFRGAEANNDAGGCKSLGFAAANGHGSVVTLLLDYSAKQVSRTSNWPELYYAARSGNASILHELARRGFAHQAKKALRQAILLDEVDVVRRLIDLGGMYLDVNAPIQKQTFLHLAVKLRGLEVPIADPRLGVVELLLNRGADVKVRNSQGQTAKELAEARGYTAAVELIQAYEHRGDDDDP